MCALVRTCSIDLSGQDVDVFFFLVVLFRKYIFNIIAAVPCEQGCLRTLKGIKPLRSSHYSEASVRPSYLFFLIFFDFSVVESLEVHRVPGAWYFDAAHCK